MADSPFPPIDFDKVAAKVNGAVKDGAHTAIGLGALAFQRAQVTRVELTKQLGSRSPRGLSEWAKTIDDAVAPVRKELDAQFDRLEQRLPSGAGRVVHSVRDVAATQERSLRKVVGLD